MSTTLEQLRVERDYLLNLLKDLKRQAGRGTTSESTYTLLYNEYEAKLIRVEHDISHHELHHDREHIAPQQPATETGQPTQNPYIVKIETTHTHIRKSVIPPAKPIRVTHPQQRSDS
jgi:hypothetical protein